MKAKVMYLVALCLLLFISKAEALPQYTMHDGIPPGQRGSWNGGPFLVDPVNPGETSFFTFCLEKTEYFYFDRPYYGSIEPYAVFGGGDRYSSDPLNTETKKLYDYALDNWSSLSLDMKKGIQMAIWAIEEEVTPGSLSGYGLSYYNDVNQNPSNYILDRNIMVLNLWTRNVISPYSDDWDYRVQSQLIEVPVPEPSTLLLLGAGLLGLGLAIRRRKR